MRLPFWGGHDELSFVRPWLFHYLLTGERNILERIDEWFLRWKEWTKTAFKHGYYAKDAEEHHHTENFTRVVARLWMFDTFRADYAEALVDMAHHIGNWSDGAPAWYDWKEHRFVARWLGTAQVGSPGLKLEGAHGIASFRYMILVEQAYLLTGEQKYLDIIADYATQWCRLIRRHQNDPKGIPVWFAEGWEPLDDGRDVPGTFLVGGAVAILLDLHRILGTREYAECARILMEQACRAHLTEEPEDGQSVRHCAIAASMLSHYRLVTGDRSLDSLAPDVSQAPLDEILPTALEVAPHGLWAAELHWLREGGSGCARVSKRPAALYALAYQITGNPQCLANGIRLASRRFALARCLGDEGRFHGCGRGNVRTVIDEDVLPVMHSTALGLHGIAFDGYAHLQPAVAYRGTQGQCGLPPAVYAAFRKSANGRAEVQLFNNGDTDESVLVLALDDRIEPQVGRPLVSPMTLPWNARWGLAHKVPAGTGRTVALAAPESPATGP